MSARRVAVFFYGLFMDADLLRGKGVHPANPRHASTPGFSLRIGQRATLTPDTTARAFGIVMELTQAELETLYSEPNVRMYRPEAVMAELADGTRAPALCFNLLEPPAPHEANAEYARKLRELAGRLGLPSDYVQNIR